MSFVLLLLFALLQGSPAGLTTLPQPALAEPATEAPGQRHGQVKSDASGQPQAYDQNQGQWLTMEAFWQAYADENGGLTWGKRSDYPPYDEVKEGDTLWVELPQGPCLMEFFHARWRRANDVRRWDPSFNDYGGCPNVFD
ncbi:hypothetical protein [Ferrimonas marina]|uniref:Uncharacterized protein n=1 Tax=Ferrimonas marina TaxID=299255 RepID=A0A1M5YC87_9GAMM|nr:hypothetical protein [Ferrimonas marina]SHI09582.1 hypothetical protein SAMN02745129_4067 [Ferrimonas marina]